ncbi:MAG: beta-ketoacyl-[acyl-carrier-protein] synthase family protein [Colwellia sp.]|nr:beta-ketoacyl-[acyl-carrier-protein] synthase family protein [Colwellia sp.]
MRTRVVVTGMGCISAAGNNIDEFYETVFSSKTSNSIAPITSFDCQNLSTKIAAEVKNYQASAHFTPKELKQLDRFAQFALLASQEAIDDANITFNDATAKRTGVIHGTSIGGQATIEHSYQQFHLEGKTRAHPFTVPKLLPSAATSQIAMRYGIKGPSFCTSSACSSSGHAIAMATMMIRSNMIDTAIVGGAEACITQGNFYAWDSLRVLASDTCRPFSADRGGLVIGEGAGTLVLESLKSANQRGAKIYAEVTGIGMSSDAHNIVQPLCEGAELAMNLALQDASFSPDEVQYLNAHGSGTIQNDQTETQAIHRVFNEYAQRLKISSTKSSHGHVLGAGSVIESIATLIALQKQQVPPTKNFTTIDAACDLDYTVNKFINTPIQHAMCNSFAFGGLNVSLIFSAI